MAVQTSQLAALNAQQVFTVDLATLPSTGIVGIQVLGNWTGTISFFGSIDGLTPFAVLATPITALGGNPTATTQANGQWAIPCYGFNTVIVKMTAYSAGTANVAMDANANNLPPSLTGYSVLQSNQGGPQLVSGLSINSGLPGSNLIAGNDPTRNFQGQGSASAQVVLTKTGDTSLVFTENPWVQGLDINNTIMLSGGPLQAAIEEVLVGPNNNPNATVGPTTVNLASPVVIGGENWTTFDNFATNGPGNSGATVMGTPNFIRFLYDPFSRDPKRPLTPENQARGNPGIAAVVAVPDAIGSNDDYINRQLLEAMLTELRTLNYMVSQLKDAGPMEVPSTLIEPRVGLTGN